MYVIIWEFQARIGQESEFEKYYGPDGEWIELFRLGKGYIGTELLRDSSKTGRYLTIDRWSSRAAYEAFRSEYDRRYLAIDERCERVRAQETLIGSMDDVE